MSTIGTGKKKEKLTLNESNQVKDIKNELGKLFGLDPNEFHLFSGEVTLDENSSLTDYSVSNGDDILLIPASTAG